MVDATFPAPLSSILTSAFCFPCSIALGNDDIRIKNSFFFLLRSSHLHLFSARLMWFIRKSAEREIEELAIRSRSGC
jgi:hypothetical protein